MKKRIIVIGKHHLEDDIALTKIGDWLADNRKRFDLRDRIWNSDYEEFDMTKFPERGDAIDAIDNNTELVVALHCFGINMAVPINPYPRTTGYLYNRNNGELLPICMEKGIILATWGDFPWLGLQKMTQIHENNLRIFEPWEQETKQIFDQLKRSAEESAKFRNHVLGKWYDYGKTSHATCTKCKKEVQVIAKPKPNEIDIAGEAVAIGCTNASI